MTFKYFIKREKDSTEEKKALDPAEIRLSTGCHIIGKNCKAITTNKLNNYNWLDDIPNSDMESEFVEVQFKNTRKGYYRNSLKLPLKKGDIVAVESNPGHDVGEVTMTGRLVDILMRRSGVKLDNEIKRIYRKAKPTDLEKWEESKKKEHDTMLRSRKIAEDLHLNMKIGDVEYQGDGNILLHC